MTTKIIYIAWDDTEYQDQEECQAYEEKCASAFYSFRENYHFYNEEMEEQTCKSITLKKIYDWIFDQYNECTYIKVDKAIPEALECITSIDDIELPEKPGFYYYDFGWNHGWKEKKE